MTRHLIRAIAVGVSIAAVASGVALGAGRVTTVRAGNIILRFTADVTPKKLPKHRLAPIFFHGTDVITTVDGSHAPAMEEAIIDVDKDILIDVEGLPVCRKSQLIALDSRSAKRACGTAMVGDGSVTVRVAFPDQTPFDAVGPLLIVNGGENRGTTTLFIHGYVAVPTPTAVVATVKIRRKRAGRYATRMVFSIPVIAGGSGSPIAGEVSVGRRYKYKGEDKSFISARCSNGLLGGKGTLKFRDDTQIVGSVFVPCTATR
ncbi:MAG TPA: hypothetical protein VNM89_05425 [Solirubrobacterales bacterium]|nr:hypothetical protein [Solirubrobacterales bacterium]